MKDTFNIMVSTKDKKLIEKKNNVPTLETML